MFSPVWLKKKPEHSKKQQPRVKIKILPPTPKNRKEFRPESPSPSPLPNRLTSFTSSLLPPPPPPPTPKPSTEAEIREHDRRMNEFGRWFALPDTPSPSQLLSPQPKRDIGITPTRREFEEESTQHESKFYLEDKETPTQKVDTPGGGKMTRKKDKNKSKRKNKGKSKNRRTIKKRRTKTR